MALAQWLVEHRRGDHRLRHVELRPRPPEDPDEPFVVPQTLNSRHGVVVSRTCAWPSSPAAGVAEFMFVVSHAKLRGATGAWVAPLAII